MDTRKRLWIALLVGTWILGGFVIVVWNSEGHVIAGETLKLRTSLPEEKKIELFLSRLEQEIRVGNVEELLRTFRSSDRDLAFQGDSAPFSQQVRELMADGAEDPREKPTVDVTVQSVQLAGRDAKAQIVVRIAKKVGRDKWSVDERVIEVQLSKQGRGWGIRPCRELLNILGARKRALELSASTRSDIR